MNRAPVVAALAVTAMLLLAACAPESTPVGANLSASATPAPSETEEPPAPDVTAGAPIDAETAAELNSTSKGQYRGFQLPDGSYIVVDKQAPLPEPVQEVANGQASQVQAANPVQGANDPFRDIVQLPGQIGAQTGKRVLVVSHISAFDDAGNPVEAYFVLGGSRMNNMRSAEEAVAAAQNYINGQSNPAEWAIVVAR